MEKLIASWVLIFTLLAGMVLFFFNSLFALKDNRKIKKDLDEKEILLRASQAEIKDLKNQIKVICQNDYKQLYENQKEKNKRLMMKIGKMNREESNAEK